MKKLLYVTGSRAEYGIMKRLLKKLDEDDEISLEIIITGMHLLKEYGETYREIEKDFKSTKKIDIEISSKDNYEVLHSMSIAMEKFSKHFRDNKYDALILLGDRYEILPVAIVAAFNNIPIIHIHGGEKTLGNYDEFVRHSITKMSKLHLVATEEYRKRVIQLGENPDTVKNLGSLGVANVLEMRLLNKKELEDIIGEIKKPYYIVLFHPETISEISLEEQTNNLIEALSKFREKYNFVFIGSNSDTGSDKIQKIIHKFVKENIDFAIYNLGYLPKGDKNITTNAVDVEKSLKKLLGKLNKNGVIFITFYIGHLCGQIESAEISRVLKNLEQKEFTVLKFLFENQKNNPPYVVMIQKR